MMNIGKEIVVDEKLVSHSGHKSFEFLPECRGVQVIDLDSKEKLFFGRNDAVAFYYFVKRHLNGFVT